MSSYTNSENLPGIQDVILAEHQPCDNIAITSWEQRYSTVLPHEIKDFYLATDGFRLTWSFSHAGRAIAEKNIIFYIESKEAQNKIILKMSYFHFVGDVLPIGHMVINCIGDLRRVAGIWGIEDIESTKRNVFIVCSTTKGGSK